MPNKLLRKRRWQNYIKLMHKREIRANNGTINAIVINKKQLAEKLKHLLSKHINTVVLQRLWQINNRLFDKSLKLSAAQCDVCEHSTIKCVFSYYRWAALMPDLCVGKGRLETTQAAQRAESSPTENSSLNKYTNLDPCCYGNLLVEFHHQGYFYCVAAGHTHTLRWLADCRPTSPVIGYLLPLCQPSVLFPSHIIKSPMGTFFLLPHHLSLFPLLLGEKGDSKMSTKGRILVDETCTQGFFENLQYKAEKESP